ncbi:WbqC-like protein family [Candidatus Magnetobacterium bavaricum]|uniref:WbqC-like protein family n=1 Tax=Candidatus Magnetobacterium bavaricum TaxID=29290 RepID=A0A0F3GHE4_9BACT|nr:WbqC-like protein family [Candidatus Magnetobacterium bavaricum]
MVVSIHQPSYFPWMGFLSKIFRSERYILMDDVQLADRAFQHRNLFLEQTGISKYLTIPFNRKGYRNKNIKDLTIHDCDWQRTHKKFIQFNYKKSHFFDEIFYFLDIFFSKKYVFLIDALIESMKLSMKLFDISTEMILQSSLVYRKDSRKSDLILELVKAVGGNIYLSGVGAIEYLIIDEFDREDIVVNFYTYEHLSYPQIHANEFVPGLSCIDVLFNIGIDSSKRLLRGVA